MLQAHILALGIFADDDQVYTRITRLQAGQIPDWTEIDVELEFLAQSHVDRGKPAADRGRHWPLESELCPLNRFVQLFRDVFLILLERIGAR